MAELKRIEEEFPKAELARDGNLSKQPEGPKLVKGQEPETLDKAVAASEPMPLFSESEMGDFRAQWSTPPIAAEMKQLGFERPEQLGALFLGDAAYVRSLVADASPLTRWWPASKTRVWGVTSTRAS